MMTADLTVLQAKLFGVFNCNKDDTLFEAAQRMVEEDISALVVIDENGFLNGIITRTDLLRAFVSLEDWEKHKVSDLMNTEVVTVTPQTNLMRVAEILLEQQIHRVVAVREEGGKKRPISVVSAADIVYHMAKNN
jgi:CBS domain-containing protein